MIRHIVAWNFKEEVSDKASAAKRIKESLEALRGEVEGLFSLEVIINEMESSTVDITLYSEFASKEALDNYQVCPAHVMAAAYIKDVCCNRTCIDYVI